MGNFSITRAGLETSTWPLQELAGSEVFSLEFVPLSGLVEGLLFLCVLVNVHNSVIYMNSVGVGDEEQVY